MNSYTDLIVWQKAVDLSVKIYKITERFPKSEVYGLTSQIRRCAVSIPSNIAEGQRRGHNQEQLQFTRIAYGSGAELETQLLIARKVGYLNEKNYLVRFLSLDEVMRMTNRLISSFLRSKV